MISVDQLALADFETDIAGHRNGRRDDDLEKLDQPAFHYGGPAELSQEPDVRHGHLKQVERGVGKDDGEYARNQQNEERWIFL